MIAHRMAVLVIDPLEMIDIQHDHRQLQSVTLCTLQLVLQSFWKCRRLWMPVKASVTESARSSSSTRLRSEMSVW